MKRASFAFIIKCLVTVMALANLNGCEVAGTAYGAPYGTYTAPSESGRRLVGSSDCVVAFDASAAVVTGMNVSKITNQITSFRDFVGPLDLTPSVATLGTLSGGWINLAPASGAQQFSTDGSNMFLSNEITVVALMKNDTRGDVISVNPNDRSNQAFEINVGAGTTAVIFRSSPTDDWRVNGATPTRPELLIGASIDSAGTMDLSINGGLDSTTVTTGSPLSPFNLPRLLLLGSSTSGQQTNIKELYVFTRRLERNEMGAVIQYIMSKNAFVADITLNAALSSGVSSAPAFTASFLAARSVIQSKCVSCHSAWNNSRPTTFTTSGLVTARDALNSKLYYRLSGSQGGNGPKTMPNAGSISADEVAAVKTWIDSL